MWRKATTQRGGSFYCDLVESEDSGKIRAQMHCTIWDRDLKRIRKQLKDHVLDLIPDGATAVDFQCAIDHPNWE